MEPIVNKICHKRDIEHLLNGLAMTIMSYLYFKKETEAYFFAEQYLLNQEIYAKEFGGGKRFDHRGKNLFDPGWLRELHDYGASAQRSGHMAVLSAR